jgi:HSP20 family protein
MLVRFDFPKTFDSLLDDLTSMDAGTLTRATPTMDVAEYENEYVVVAEVPGVKKEDVKITLEKNILTIQGQRKPYEISEDARVLLNEMRVREFSRSIQVPPEVDSEHISAELENGVLRLVLPKVQNARVRSIAIK